LIPLPIIAALAAVLISFAAGYTFEHRACRAEIARREAAAAEESRRRIEAASRAMDAVLAEKDRRLLALDATNRRLRHELQAATTGRACLSADARRLLQQSPAFGTTVPQTTGGTLATPAAPATDSPLPSPSGRGAGGEGDTTDTDIAQWILDVAGLYEQCRARIDALRKWDEVTYGR
jgi:hypothetical protein